MNRPLAISAALVALAAPGVAWAIQVPPQTGAGATVYATRPIPFGVFVRAEGQLVRVAPAAGRSGTFTVYLYRTDSARRVGRLVAKRSGRLGLRARSATVGVLYPCSPARRRSIFYAITTATITKGGRVVARLQSRTSAGTLIGCR